MTNKSQRTGSAGVNNIDTSKFQIIFTQHAPQGESDVRVITEPRMPVIEDRIEGMGIFASPHVGTQIVGDKVYVVRGEMDESGRVRISFPTNIDIGRRHEAGLREIVTQQLEYGKYVQTSVEQLVLLAQQIGSGQEIVDFLIANPFALETLAVTLYGSHREFEVAYSEIALRSLESLFSFLGGSSSENADGLIAFIAPEVAETPWKVQVEEILTEAFRASARQAVEQEFEAEIASVPDYLTGLVTRRQALATAGFQVPTVEIPELAAQAQAFLPAPTETKGNGTGNGTPAHFSEPDVAEDLAAGDGGRAPSRDTAQA